MRIVLRFDDIAHRGVFVVQHVVMLTPNQYRQKVRLCERRERYIYLEISDGLDRVKQLQHRFRHEVTFAVMEVCVKTEGGIAWKQEKMLTTRLGESEGCLESSNEREDQHMK